MSSAAAPPRERAPSGESIGFEAPTREQGESLAAELAEFEPSLHPSAGGAWLVEIAPDRELTPLMIKLFHAVSGWLDDNELASVEVHFGSHRYTLLHPSEAWGGHSAEFLLQRVIQLQTALDSRVAIEQAKGFLVAQLRVGVEEAFELLRHAARSAGRQLHELAEEVVGSHELPPELRRAIEARRDRGSDV